MEEPSPSWPRHWVCERGQVTSPKVNDPKAMHNAIQPARAKPDLDTDTCPQKSHQLVPPDVALTLCFQSFIACTKPPLAIARAASCDGPVHLFVCLSVCLCLSPNCKNAIFSKTKQFRAMVSIDDLQEVVYGLFKEPIIGPLKSKMAEIRHLENRHAVIFSAEGGPIQIKFRRLVQNDMSTAMIWSKSKPDVEFQYGGRLGEFNGVSSQSHVSHCRVLPLGEFTAYDSTTTCHIARCSLLAKSVL